MSCAPALRSQPVQAGGSRRRLPALDGLRGVAAFVVLVHHALLTVPVLAAPYYSGRPPAGEQRLAWMLVSTPVHLVWAGTEAVFVFFVLSGLVLTLPVGRAVGSYGWRAYYPRRLVRLYVPVVAAVVLGSLLPLVVTRDGGAAMGAWLAHRPPQPTAEGVLADVTLVGGVSRLISPLWSLQWEVWFSLLLPAFVVAAVKGRRWVWSQAALLVVLTGLGEATARPWLTYLPMFGAGVLLATHLEDVRAWGARLGSRTWAAAVAGAVLLLSSYWLVLPQDVDPAVLTMSRPAALVGAVVVVVAAASWDVAQRVLTWKPVHWLGTISFSLYLVHEPIVIATAYVVGPGRSEWVLPLALPVALLVATGFYRLVEQPSHRLARRLSARLAASDRATSRVRPTPK
ncbi:MAG: acyltransferase family protein [Angustibacter sp.]